MIIVKLVMSVKPWSLIPVSKIKIYIKRWDYIHVHCDRGIFDVQETWILH